MLKRTLEGLVAGSIIYAAMAACSGGGGTASTRAPGAAGAPMATTEGGQPASGGAPHQSDGAGMSNAGSPVPDAMAAGGGEGQCGCAPVEPKEPTIVEAECTETTAGSPSMWAIAEFPGKSALELAGVVALVEPPPSLNKWPSGFTHSLGAVILKDGAAAVTCGSASAPSTNALSVTFVLP